MEWPEPAARSTRGAFPIRRRSLLVPRTFAILALATGLGACGPDETTYVVTDVRTGERPAEPFPEGMDTVARFGGQRRESAEPAGLRWTTPEGWREKPKGPMRLASFDTPGDPPADVSLTRVGGSVAENVNRWRSQMGQEPLDAAAIEALPRAGFLGRDSVLVELEGSYRGTRGERDVERARLIGLVGETDQGLAFAKMVGEDAVVAAQRDAFLRFAASVERAPTATAATPPSTPRPATPAPKSPFAWTTPEGWEQVPHPSRVRLATFRPVGQPQPEVVLSLLEGTGGGVFENVNFWRGQAGAEPLTAAEVDALPRVEALGVQATWVEVRGAGSGEHGAPVGEAMLIGLIVPLEGRTLFLKMTGPVAAVEAELERFRTLALSLRHAES